jgi:hypothetical protein
MRLRKFEAGWVILLLTGCASAPVTDGYHADLPKPGTQTIVWGNDVSAVGIATTWLQKRGLAVIERNRLALDLNANNIQLTNTHRDEPTLLEAAKKLQVSEIVFVDRGGDDRAPMITVRGVSVESGWVTWSGSARYATFETRPPKDALANLTCEALATAWDFRRPGQRGFTSSQSMCEVESRQ